MNFQKTNLNYCIKVKLKEDGLKILEERRIRLQEKTGKEIKSSDFFDAADSEGYHQFEMWYFIHIFGEHTNICSDLYETEVLIQIPEKEND